MRDRVRPRGDDRAVSPVVGAILLFAVLLGLLAIVQTTAIPALNGQLEVQHNQRVTADMLALDAAVDRTAATGAGETVTIEAGMGYPPRMLFVNPPPVTGTIRTHSPAAVEIANAEATGEAGDYWDGTTHTFPTKSVVYTAGYNEYRRAPRTVFESWVLYNRFEDGTTLETRGSFIDGRRITLVTLDGGVSRSTQERLSLDVDPASAPAEGVMVHDETDPVTVTLPTGLPRDAWETLLADEVDPTGNPSNDRYVTDITCQRVPPAPCGRLTVTLERGVGYELRLGTVHVGDTPTEPAATYIVDVDGDETSIPENGSQRLVLEVRDRFDNPVSDVRVTTRRDGPGRVRPVTPVTGADGRATFVYEAPADVVRTTDVTVTASFGAATPQQTATLTIQVMNLDGSSSNGRSPP